MVNARIYCYVVGIWENIYAYFYDRRILLFLAQDYMLLDW